MASRGVDRDRLDDDAPVRRRSRALTLLGVVIALLVVAGAGYGAAILVSNSFAAPPVGVTAPSAGTGPTASSSTPAASATARTGASSSAVPSAAASPSAAPVASPRIHVVARGENLTAIARRYGVTVAAIVKANGIRDPNKVILGQRLVIPAR